MSVYGKFFGIWNEGEVDKSWPQIDTRAGFLSQLGGHSFGGGLYRVMPEGQRPEWDSIVGDLFPSFAGIISCFGWDWLGRAYALDTRQPEGRETVLMLDPCTGDTLKAASDFEAFHNEALIEYAEEILERTKFSAWLAHGRGPRIDECVGFKVPLLLGGKDEQANLELSNTEVYWELLNGITKKVNGSGWE